MVSETFTTLQASPTHPGRCPTSSGKRRRAKASGGTSTKWGGPKPAEPGTSPPPKPEREQTRTRNPQKPPEPERPKLLKARTHFGEAEFPLQVCLAHNDCLFSHTQVKIYARREAVHPQRKPMCRALQVRSRPKLHSKKSPRVSSPQPPAALLQSA